MDVLSERVTDLLEEAYKASSNNVTTTPEYINFDSTFEDDITKKLRTKAAQYTEAQAKVEYNQNLTANLRKDAAEIAKQVGQIPKDASSGWYSLYPNDVLRRYIQEQKEKQFPNAEFNREKTLRRVQADILLSDVENPEQLVKSLVEKLK